jgi:hypothetical protein
MSCYAEALVGLRQNDEGLTTENVLSFLGAFAKLRKATISFCLSDCLSVCPSVHRHGTARLPMDGFTSNFTF